MGCHHKLYTRVPQQGLTVCALHTSLHRCSVAYFSSEKGAWSQRYDSPTDTLYMLLQRMPHFLRMLLTQLILQGPALACIRKSPPPPSQRGKHLQQTSSRILLMENAALGCIAIVHTSAERAKTKKHLKVDVILHDNCLHLWCSREGNSF